MLMKKYFPRAFGYDRKPVPWRMLPVSDDPGM